ncbi:unnamed protein product [Amoebophrya sp. A120]|nr:unnamed protein product [Amoebophrya sp. A120]|eukprot:GSA120T00007761001.1
MSKMRWKISSTSSRARSAMTFPPASTRTSTGSTSSGTKRWTSSAVFHPPAHSSNAPPPPTRTASNESTPRLGVGLFGTLRAPRFLAKWRDRCVAIWKTMHKVDHCLRYRLHPRATDLFAAVNPHGPIRQALRAAEQAALIAGLEEDVEKQGEFETLVKLHLEKLIAFEVVEPRLDENGEQATAGRQQQEQIPLQSCAAAAMEQEPRQPTTSRRSENDLQEDLSTQSHFSYHDSFEANAGSIFRTCEYLVKQHSDNDSPYIATLADLLCKVARTKSARSDFETKSEWELRIAQEAYSLALNLLKSSGDFAKAKEVFEEATGRRRREMLSTKNVNGAATHLRVSTSAGHQEHHTTSTVDQYWHAAKHRLLDLKPNDEYIHWQSLCHTPAIFLETELKPPRTSVLEEKLFWTDDARLHHFQQVMRAFKPFIEEELRHFVIAYNEGSSWAMEVMLENRAEKRVQLAESKVVLNGASSNSGGFTRRSTGTTTAASTTSSFEAISCLDQKRFRPAPLQALPAVKEMLMQMKSFNFGIPYTHEDSEACSLIRLGRNTRCERWQSQGSNLSISMCMGLSLDGPDCKSPGAFVEFLTTTPSTTTVSTASSGNAASPGTSLTEGVAFKQERHSLKNNLISFASGWDHRFGTTEITPEEAATTDEHGSPSGSGFVKSTGGGQQEQAHQEHLDESSSFDSGASWFLHVNTLHPALVANEHLCASIGRRTEWEIVGSRQAHQYARAKQNHEYLLKNPVATPIMDRFKSKGGFSRKHLPTDFNVYRPPA